MVTVTPRIVLVNGPLARTSLITAIVEAGERASRITLPKIATAMGRQIVKWRKQGLGFDVCVNLASSELGRTGLASAYAGIVREHGAECSNFTFEVVEQDLVDPDAAHLDTLKRLRNQGFSICLDNFRVAARSLSTLTGMTMGPSEFWINLLLR